MFIENSPSISILGIYGAALIANLFPFLPEEVFLLGYGYLNGIGVLPNFVRLSFFLILGLFTTDIVWFILGRKGNKIVRKFISTVLGEDFKKNEAFIKKHTGKIIIISRFLTVIRAIGPVLAGSVHTPWKKFLTYNAVALMMYVPIILGIGRYFQDRIESVVNGVDVVGNIVSFVLFLIGVIIILRFIRKHFISRLKFSKEGLNMKSAITKVEEKEN